MKDAWWKYIYRSYIFLFAILSFFVISKNTDAEAVTWSATTIQSGATASSTVIIYNPSATEYAAFYTPAGGGSIKVSTSTDTTTWSTPFTVGTTPTNMVFYGLDVTTTTGASPYYAAFGTLVASDGGAYDVGQIGRNRLFYSANGNSASWTLSATSSVTSDIHEGAIAVQGGRGMVFGKGSPESNYAAWFGKSATVGQFDFTTSSIYAGTSQPSNFSIDAISGEVAITYKSTSFTTINVATSTNGTTWNSSTISESGGGPAFTIARYDSTGKLWVAYMKQSGADCSSGCTLNLARYESASGWQKEQVDSMGTVLTDALESYRPIDLAFVNGTTPVVVYSVASSGAVKYAYRDSGNSGCSGSAAANYTCGTVASSLGTSYVNRVSVTTNNAAQVTVMYDDFTGNAIKAATADFTATAATPVAPSPAKLPPPTIDEFLINGGATTTATTTVTVTLRSGSASEMSLALDENFMQSIWEPYVETSKITLSAQPGLQRVYAKVSNSANGVSATEYREILYQPIVQVATGTIAIAESVNGFVSSTQATVVLTYSPDSRQVQVSADPTFAGAAWQPVVTSTPWTFSEGEGKRDVYARFKTEDGTTSNAYTATVFVDMTAPAAPSVTIPAAGAALGDPRLVTAGFAEVGERVRISLQAGAAQPYIVGEVIVDPQRAWSLATTTTLAYGAYTMRAVAVDGAGNVSSATAVAFNVLDTAAPAAPVVTAPTPGALIAVSAIETTGTAEPGAKIVITRNKKVTYTAIANADGLWGAHIVGLTTGQYVLEYQAFDAAGNASAPISQQLAVALPVVKPEPEPEPEPVQPPAPKQPAAPTPPAPGPSSGEASAGPSAGSGASGSPGSVTSSGETQPAEQPTTPLSSQVETELAPAQGVSAEVASETSGVIVSAASLAESVADAAAATGRQVKKAAKVVREVADQPEVQVANQAVVVPTTAVAAAASVGTAVNASQFIVYLRYLFTQPLFLLARRRRTGWGVAYNALTKMPLDLAMVRLVDTQQGKVVQSHVTDREGRYQFFARPGQYALEVVKPDYTFPPEYMKGRAEDGRYTDLYTGGAVPLAAANTVSYNLPLDPGGTAKTDEQLFKELRKKKIAAILSPLGVVVTAVSFVVSPTWIVGTFLVIHVVSYVAFRRIAMPKKPETWGVVRDSSGKPVEKAVVRVFDTQYNKLLETQVTDKLGRYAFLVGKNSYYVIAEKPGFVKKTTDSIAVADKEGGSVFAPDITLEAVGEAVQPPVAAPQPTPAVPVAAPVAPPQQQSQPPSTTPPQI